MILEDAQQLGPLDIFRKKINKKKEDKKIWANNSQFGLISKMGCDMLDHYILFGILQNKIGLTSYSWAPLNRFWTLPTNKMGFFNNELHQQ